MQKKFIVVLLATIMVAFITALASAQTQEPVADGEPDAEWYIVEDYSIISGIDIQFADGRTVRVTIDEGALDSTSVKDVYDLAYECLMRGYSKVTIHGTIISDAFSPTDGD